ncbi:hypothetical protein C0992_006979 [Termitomyces sp. T32_za158]|nr:hypothetical protein C0992_006979 [Termitomyces sp. T32_za158]
MHRRRDNSHLILQDHLQQAYAGQQIFLTAGRLPRQSGSRLVTLNFARLALEMHHRIEGDELILWLLTSDAVRATKSICEHWSPTADVLLSWDIIQTPFFRKYTTLSNSSRDFTHDANTNSKKLKEFLNT